jgi:hypothetical protein
MSRQIAFRIFRNTYLEKVRIRNCKRALLHPPRLVLMSGRPAGELSGLTRCNFNLWAGRDIGLYKVFKCGNWHQQPGFPVSLRVAGWMAASQNSSKLPVFLPG